MRKNVLVPACGLMLALVACSGSDSDADVTTGTDVAADAGAADEPEILEGDQISDQCPASSQLTAATGIDMAEPQGVILETDDLGVDSDAGATICAYDFGEVSSLVLTVHGSDVDTSLLGSVATGEEALTELSDGAVQLQLGENDCEVYGGQLSMQVFVDAADSGGADPCSIVASVWESLR